jgi:hypothetical protein
MQRINHGEENPMKRQTGDKRRSRSGKTASVKAQVKKAVPARCPRRAELKSSDTVETDRSEADAVEFRKRKSEIFLGPFSDSFTQVGSNAPPPSVSRLEDRLAAAKGVVAVSLIHMSGSSSAVVNHFARSGLGVPSEAEVVALLMWLFSASLATLTFSSAMKVIIKSPWLS